MDDKPSPCYLRIIKQLLVFSGVMLLKVIYFIECVLLTTESHDQELLLQYQTISLFKKTLNHFN